MVSFDAALFARLVDLRTVETLSLDGNRIGGDAFLDFVQTCRGELERRRDGTAPPLEVGLRRNAIATVDGETARRVLGARNATHRERLALFLEGNPLECNCSNKRFGEMLNTAHGRTLVVDWHRLTCRGYSENEFLCLHHR